MQVRITLTSAAGDETFAILNATPAEMEAYQKLAQVLSDNEEGAFAPHMEVEVVPPPPPDLPIPPPGDTFWVSTYGKGIVVALSQPRRARAPTAAGKSIPGKRIEELGNRIRKSKSRKRNSETKERIHNGKPFECRFDPGRH